MLRLLFWIALGAFIYWLWRRAIRPKPPASRGDESAEPMVRCAQCGVHVPRTQALQHEQRWYCSRAHLEQDHANRGQ
ncbi:hypothetical protein D9M68_488520 [compost metagenome]|uniref:MYND finger n=1 Tax=Pseudomonas jinjuensis TaxID=198616 RepID=A0A1H0ML19_9PSED|nr:PP0621 family protein [Pseudomonas jinjuensis]SDO80830.1 uncharacterized protein SAMN05216193_11640 [Pseudomonas jinjuensis]